MFTEETNSPYALCASNVTQRRDISVLLQQLQKLLTAAATKDATATCHFVKEIKVLFSAETNSYNKIIAAQLQSGKCNDLSLWPIYVYWSMAYSIALYEVCCLAFDQ